ncbi:hypothetical protein WMY93_032809 [Mugilogobius chulae]|uniref:Uncharacterized protein n=1 Tax=Mugilogobius chulae TaxID=88201 RepID=A0AAW0MK90_9GOBI
MRILEQNGRHVLPDTAPLVVTEQTCSSSRADSCSSESVNDYENTVTDPASPIVSQQLCLDSNDSSDDEDDDDEPNYVNVESMAPQNQSQRSVLSHDQHQTNHERAESDETIDDDSDDDDDEDTEGDYVNQQ